MYAFTNEYDYNKSQSRTANMCDRVWWKELPRLLSVCAYLAIIIVSFTLHMCASIKDAALCEYKKETEGMSFLNDPSQNASNCCAYKYA